MGDSIGLLIQNYQDTKEDYQDACRKIIHKAIEIGMDAKTAEDVRVSLAFLKGYGRKKP